MPITSSILLNLGQVPEGITDPILYEALLNIHNALDLLAQAGSGTVEAELDFSDFIASYLAVRVVETNYNIMAADGLVLANAATQPIVLSLPAASDSLGARFSIKCIDNTFPVTVLGASAGETIDQQTTGISLTLYDSITVKSDGTDWWII